MKPMDRAPSIDLLRGSLVRFRRKCGGKNCRCQHGEPHESWALSYSIQRRTHLISLHDEDVEGVKAAVERYQIEKEQLEDRALKGLSKLRAGLAARRRTR